MAVVQARLDPQEAKELDGLVRRLGWSRSRVMREGLRVLGAIHPAPRKPKFYGRGKFASGIPDLATNKKHMEGFGR